MAVAEAEAIFRQHRSHLAVRGVTYTVVTASTRTCLRRAGSCRVLFVGRNTVSIVPRELGGERLPGHPEHAADRGLGSTSHA